MMTEVFKRDDGVPTRFPIYNAPVEACKVGCLACGAALQLGEVFKQGIRPPGQGRWGVQCRCGEVAHFDVASEIAEARKGRRGA